MGTLLLRSAARQWAADRISVSLIVVPLGLIVSDAGDLVTHVGRGARKDVDLLDAVVRAVHFILSGARGPYRLDPGGRWWRGDGAMTLGGLTALVTGAGGGVGRGIALASAAAGGHVFVGSRGTNGEVVTGEIRARGH